jgi:GntR family transcriptional regulator
MIPFRVDLQPGVPLHEQISFAARKALVSGHIRPGDPFPSVRALSVSLKINPNTAHKVITQLVAEGLLEVRSGIGTVVAPLPGANRADRARLLASQVEQLVVQARCLGLALEEVQSAVEGHWKKLNPKERR